MKILNLVESKQISGGKIRLNDGIEIPTHNISRKCENLFQEILPDHYDQCSEYCSDSILMTFMRKVTHERCLGDFQNLLDNMYKLTID